MANKTINKVIFGGDTLIDLTQDTVVQSAVLNPYTFHAPNGAVLTGSCTYDVDSRSVTAAQSEVLATKTFAKNGQILTGTMPNIGAAVITISTNADVNIPAGYHDGAGKVMMDSVEKGKLIPGNIRQNVVLFGVTGTYTGNELIRATTATFTPDKNGTTLLPDDFGDYQYFTQVTVAPIPYVEVQNNAGGYTAQIAT